LSDLIRRWTTVALVLAPMFLLADNLLHPKEFKSGNEIDQLAEIADNYTLWQLSHALGFVAVVLFAFVVAGLGYFVGRGAPQLGLASAALGIVGLIGLASVLVLDGYTWAVLGQIYDEGYDKNTIVRALNIVQNSNWSYLYYLTPLAFILGMLSLAAGLVRQGVAEGPAAVLLALGTLMVGTETVIVNNAYFIAGAVVMLAGCWAVAYYVARVPSEEG
jgi:hypothetical protein